MEDVVLNLPKAYQKQVHEYLAGNRRQFELDIVLNGTEFQKVVWRAMLKIPYGQTRSYKQLAQAIGSPKAYRAVANACGKNPYPIVVPCHRVVATGGLGGFSLGIDIKKRLLRLEGAL
jgi:O-6-methylguanine DNA methyltransferase